MKITYTAMKSLIYSGLLSYTLLQNFVKLSHDFLKKHIPPQISNHRMTLEAKSKFVKIVLRDLFDVIM